MVEMTIKDIFQIRTDRYTFMPDRFPSGYTEAQKHAHYQEQKYLFIIEALNTPYELVTQEMINKWHREGLQMAHPRTGIGRRMREDMLTHQAKYAWKNKSKFTLVREIGVLWVELQILKARLWWGITRKKIIKNLMRV